jgi:sugar lactone lactonase YvrE
VKRRLLAGTAVVTLLAAGAAWWWTRDRAPEPLETGWRASVRTFAGDGTPGLRDGWRGDARFADPFGVAAGPGGMIYVADAGEQGAIREIAPDGRVTTLNTPAMATPSGVAVTPEGIIFVAATGSNEILRIEPGGATSVLAGAASGLNGPIGIAFDPSGRLIVADTYNDRIIAAALDGTITPIAGTGAPGFIDGLSGEASFDTPTGVAVGQGGEIYVADLGNSAVRVITRSGEVRTIAPGPADPFLRPVGVATGADGAVYIADDRGRVLEVMPSGGVRIIAGGAPGFVDGEGLEARFRSPSGIAVLSPGRLVVSDRRNALIRTVEAGSRSVFRPPAAPSRPIAFDTSGFDRAPLLWPFAPFEGPFEITGTLGEPRGGAGSERLHAGLDVYAAEGTVVHAIRDGVVDHPLATFDFGTITESMRIGPIAYIHIRAGRGRRDEPLADPRFVFTTDASGTLQRVRVKRGSRFRTGEPIGTVNRFYHVHLNIGSPGEEVNPLQFRLPHYEDTVPPTIRRGGIQLVGLDGAVLKGRARGRLLVNAPARIVVDAWDQVNGNEPRRRLGLFRLGYGLLPRGGAGPELPVQEMLRFDRQPADPEAPRLIYADGSGIPAYGSRSSRFLYRVTSTYRDGIASDGVFDPARVAPGDYTLRILAADYSGNEAIANRDLPIRILPQATSASVDSRALAR